MKKKIILKWMLTNLLVMGIFSGCGLTGENVTQMDTPVFVTQGPSVETTVAVKETESPEETAEKITVETAETKEDKTEAPTEEPTEKQTETSPEVITEAATMPEPTTPEPTTPEPTTPEPTTPEPTTPEPTTQQPPMTQPVTTEAVQTGNCDIESESCWAAIEADVVLTGSGTGYHAKLVICTPASAVSYGIQYDSCAVAPYTGKAMAMIENIGGNNPGGQSYFRPGNKELKLGQSYRMMITYNQDGSGSVYLDGNKIGDYSNPNLANQEQIYYRVEGSGRKNGDSVTATFTNIKLKMNGVYSSRNHWGTHEFRQNATIISYANPWNHVTISGSVSGLSASDDWDNRYNDVSGIIQFVE